MMGPGSIVHRYLLHATPEQRRRFIDGTAKMLLRMAEAQAEWVEVHKLLLACTRTTRQTLVAWWKATP